MRKPLLAIALLSACAGNSARGTGGNVGFGGAQDIGELRGILDQGGIPGADTLDANGFFNEHYSELPAADCGQVLCLEPMLAVGKDWLSGGYQATLQIAINTPVDPSTYQRLPLDLVVVVDRSGSMAEDGRLDKVKHGLDTLIDQLHPEDHLALVSFDDQVRVDATFAPELDRAALHADVAALQPGGATNIYGGLQAGFELAQADLGADRQHRVILLSDGNATSGIVDPTQIIAMADDYLGLGMGLTTIGVGLDFDVELMRGLAEHGAGNFYFLEDAAAADEVFTEELDYFVSPLALDVRIGATAGAGYAFGDVAGTHLWSGGSNNGTMAVPAVFVASRESQTGEVGRRGGGSSIFVRLLPVDGVVDDGQVATLTLSYRLPGGSERISQTVSMVNPNPRGEVPADTWVSHQAMMEHYAMYNVYLGLAAATRDAASDYDCALSEIAATRTGAAAWQAAFDDPDIGADLVLLDQFAGNLRAHGAVDHANACSDGIDNPNAYPEYACAAGGRGGPGAALLVLAAALVSRRRRRR